MKLEALREELTTLDTEIIKLVARRQQIVAEIGRSKQRQGRGTRDYGREKVVIETARENARRHGVTPELAESVMQQLIRSSLTKQEQDMVVASGHGEGKTALVIGGCGKIGAWFSGFLSSQGYAVQIADPEAVGYGARTDWREGPVDHNVVVVAAPLVASNTIMQELATRKPPGLIFDVASLKMPVRDGLDALSAAGCRVASLHPMFGPDTQLLSGKHVIFIEMGHDRAMEEAKALFASTMAVQVDMSLDDHDRHIAYVLGLSHILNIIFFSALSNSGETAQQLAEMSSTTFDAQLSVAKRVSEDNPHLYFEIQRLNQYRSQAFDSLLSAVTQVQDLIDQNDEAGFTMLMEQGRRYLSARQQ